MTRILLVSCLLFAACKKNDEAKPAAPQAAEKKVDDKAPAAAATPPELPKTGEPAKVAAAGVTIANAAEYDTKATELTEKVIGAFTANGKDCDKLAAELSKVIDDNRATFDGLKAFETANPDSKKAFDAKMEPREKEFEEQIGPSIVACQSHAGLKAALEKMPLN